MSTHSSHGPAGSPSTVTSLPGVTAQAGEAPVDAAFYASRGSPEGRYLAGAGKPIGRQVTDLQGQRADAAVKDQQSQGAVERAEKTDKDRKESHRGGDRPWLLRWFIPVGIVAEAVTAYVAVEVLVASRPLAEGLSMLTALIGGGLACILANRRLNQLSVPGIARIIEGVFVAVLTVLRYESLHVQGADALTAGGAAALAAIISALGLLGIEEIVVETRTFGVFLSSLRVSWKRWRCAHAATRLAKIQARIDAAAEKLHQHFLNFLLKTEGLQLDEARRRASALRAALTESET
jgi:hypothetical protein